ncbi:glycosyltransferase family 4 protein [Bacteroides salyersiae]|uniref:glycosyltransferase family 4 protein n=1 Tax=Bacteroides salyersiae TaxID=291644 RepID=UPI00221E5AE9|nr:glycosyltransferase family 4 protein [Bacteroides salyersiae]UYU39326.1 glycosyltransferase family 4 protein [Bacteroides salyersiae]
MHLVIIRTSLSYVDSQTYNIQEIGLAKELIKQGVAVSLILPGETELENHDNDYSIYYLTCKMLQQSIGFYEKLWKTLDRIQPDIIQIHEIGMFMSLYTLMWSRKNSIPCVLIQGTYEPTRKPLQRILECLFNMTFGKYILTHVNAIGCKTPRAMEYLRKYSRFQKMEVTAIGLDMSNFDQCYTVTVDWREELQISSSTKILLYIGVVENRRHVELLLEIIENLPDIYTLIIVGEGSQKEVLKKRTEQSVYKSRVKWLSRMTQKELVGIYKIADLFLLASDYEIYGMVILESMYWKVPVLSTATGGGVAIIRNNENGWIIDSFSLQDWVNKIEKIFSDSFSYNSIVETAYRDVVEKYTWEHISSNFMRLYNTAIQNQNHAGKMK